MKLIVRIAKPTLLFAVFLLPDQKPDVMYADIGGMDIQKQEVREAVELPLTHFELYKQVRYSRNAKYFLWIFHLTPISMDFALNNNWFSFLRLALTHPGVSLCTDLRDVVRPCWPRLWHITLQVSPPLETCICSCTKTS